MACLKHRFRIIFILLAVSFFFSSYAESVSSVAEKDSAAQGYEAYRAGDWNTAVFLLRKAVSLNSNPASDTLYMLIMAEMHNQDYTGALADTDVFLTKYKDSLYVPYVQYQKGRASYYTGDYDAAVLLLSDFCHENPQNEMYASALFWMAESFYTACRYETARNLYERIVTDFASDAKAPESQYRIETIDQRAREEKLLYLLKKTGEEYLAAKENYEKQLKEYQAEGLVGIQRQLKSEQDKNAALTVENESLKQMNSELKNNVEVFQKSAAGNKDSAANRDILLLKQKAGEVEDLMKSRNGR